MQKTTLYKMESHGTNGSFGIEIIISATKLPKYLDSDKIYKAKCTAASILESAVREKIKEENPNTAKETAENRKLITEVFPANIFVEEIPNGYCRDWCCRHLPWFIVTTKIGRFVIGWRKRVISIDWEQTTNYKDAEDLFPNEDVTKSGRTIHAWGIEKAAEYVGVILSS